MTNYKEIKPRKSSILTIEYYFKTYPNNWLSIAEIHYKTGMFYYTIKKSIESLLKKEIIIQKENKYKLKGVDKK